MRTEVTELRTEAVYSDDGEKRYLLRKTWDECKPKLAIVMLAAGEADGIQLDTTTQLVINNASRLGYGSVAIVNLSATLNDYTLKHADDDPENIETIVAVSKDAECVVYAPGTGKAKNKTFIWLQEQVLRVLVPFESKLFCLCGEEGEGRLQHPLSPQVRRWELSQFKVAELITLPEKIEPKAKKKPKAKEGEEKTDA